MACFTPHAQNAAVAVDRSGWRQAVDRRRVRRPILDDGGDIGYESARSCDPPGCGRRAAAARRRRGAAAHLGGRSRRSARGCALDQAELLAQRNAAARVTADDPSAAQEWLAEQFDDAATARADFVMLVRRDRTLLAVHQGAAPIGIDGPTAA